VIQKIIYHSLKLYCRIALHFYFSKWQIRKLAPIPNGPVIFVANHQNAFLDAVLMICSSTNNPWALTRSNVFKKKLARTILTIMKMLPVYRFRDGFDTLRKNEAIMDQCALLMKQGESILIFGEGNHNDHYNLRTLQKGFARIAQAALQQDVAVQIVPVGIHYEAHTAFRGRVLVSFGASISVAKDFFTENPVQKTDLLLREVAAKLTPLILSIPETQYETTQQYLQTNKSYHADLVTQLNHEQQLVNSPGIIHETKKVNRLGFGQHVIRAYYLLNHWPARLFVRSITGKPKLDPQFIGSLKFASGMVLVPLFYLIQIALVVLLSNSLWITLAYALSLPLSIVVLKPR